jgi:hypothetical protein
LGGKREVAVGSLVFLVTRDMYNSGRDKILLKKEVGLGGNVVFGMENALDWGEPVGEKVVQFFN